MRTLYLILAVLGFILPYAFAIPFFTQNGFNLAFFAQQMFADPVASSISIDVLISALALWVFVFTEGPRRGMKNLWVYVLVTLVVGVSFALPLFLYFREGTLHPSQ